MEEEHRSEGALRDTAPEPRYRGSNNMYRGVTISVKALTGAILAGSGRACACHRVSCGQRRIHRYV